MSQIANVNFEILLKMHGGDMGRAQAAWNKICALGKYGDVPATYSGGLDVRGLQVADEETKQGVYKRMNPLYGKVLGQPEFVTTAPISSDDVKRIEDLASGDKVKEN